MFDLSWIELLFCAMLALIVVGPKDLPRMLKTFASGIRRMRKFYSDIQSSVHKLEKEVDLASGDRNNSHSWQNYLPDDIKRLPDDFVPGQIPAEEYQAIRESYREEVNKAKAKYHQNHNTPEAVERPSE